MFQGQIRFLMSSLVIFFGIIFLEAGFISIVIQSLPNQFEFVIIENFKFYRDLLHVNPVAAGRLILIENPVFVIQRIDRLNSSQLWAIYFMPISVLTQYVLSMFIVFIKKQNANPFIWLWIFVASTFLLFAVFYLRIQACCTSKPTWLLDVWLLSQIYNPLLDSTFWQGIYVQLSQWLPLIQFFIAAIALLILFICYFMNARARKRDL